MTPTYGLFCAKTLADINRKKRLQIQLTLLRCICRAYALCASFVAGSQKIYISCGGRASEIATPHSQEDSCHRFAWKGNCMRALTFTFALVVVGAATLLQSPGLSAEQTS